MQGILGVMWVVLLGGCANGGASEPGSLIDHQRWVRTDGGTEFFDAPTPDAKCDAAEGDGYGFELLGGVEVFSVSTLFCDYITVTQSSTRSVRAGDTLGMRFRHGDLTSPAGGEAHVGLVIGDEIAWERTFPIPRPSAFFSEEWLAPRDFPEGSPILFHIHNHGSNGYSLVDFEIL